MNADILGDFFYYLEQNPDSVENENWGRKSDWRTARVNRADERGGNVSSDATVTIFVQTQSLINDQSGTRRTQRDTS